MSKPTTPRDLLIQEIKGLYSSEVQLMKALPRMARAAKQSDLKNAFARHLDETRRHARRIEEMMIRLAVSPRGKRCKTMEGLLEEGREGLAGIASPGMRDLALIAVAQKIEHHEIAGYGCARTLADMIGESELADALQETLDEEGAADKRLTEIALALNVEDSPITADPLSD